ncbi:hypothetical protein [Odoribacter laneus]|jgi:hypothetical protein|uniref:Uncharacterized protein n=1 Tax=Odoribacter laneus YIT 12061 TaxID=742817 RepID=H1DGB3_9BACT|nr:hypothetical protein [Odoribacter laneus]EHP48101.1 hypothetical protein HMPREF9449_01299 [Odoribacter laneus YIT 12061]
MYRESKEKVFTGLANRGKRNKLRTKNMKQIKLGAASLASEKEA